MDRLRGALEEAVEFVVLRVESEAGAGGADGEVDEDFVGWESDVSAE